MHILDKIYRFGYGCAIFLEREAGHSLISLTLIGIGMAFADGPGRSGLARDIAMIGIGALGRGMGSNIKDAPKAG